MKSPHVFSKPPCLCVAALCAALMSTLAFADGTTVANGDSPDVAIPIILPETLVQSWLQNDPEIGAADNAFDAASAEAEQTAVSPYEWNARYTKQQRDYGSGPKSDEWNMGVERTFRLPGKYGADQTNARASYAAACADRNLNKRDAAMHLLDAYLEWQTARSGKILLLQQQQLAQRSVDAVTKRVKSGDASALEQKLVSAELLDVQRQANEADIAEASAWAQFSARYSIGATPMPNLPDPVAIDHDADWWQTKIKTGNDQLQVSRAQYQAAQAVADRARADRLPDPTLGVFVGKEAYGDEKIVGVSVSMPIPGTRRNLEQRKQLAKSNIAYQDMVLAERQIDNTARAAYVAAVGHYQRWQLTRNSLDLLHDNAALGQRAYELGEQDLQTLLLAQRQGLIAAQSEMEAKVAALRSYYKLLLEAKLIWTTQINNTQASCSKTALEAS